MIKKIQNTAAVKACMMFICGVLYTGAFAPFSVWPLSIFALGYLFYCWQNLSAKQSAWLGFLFGLGTFGTGISWMYVSISTFGGMPALLAGFCIFVLVVLLSLYLAVTGYIQTLLAVNSVMRLLIVIPVLWILFEWLRGWLFTGLPWLLLGYSYIDTPLAGYASIGGVYFVGFIAASIIALLVYCIQKRRFIALIPIFVLVAAGFGLKSLSFTQAKDKPVHVAIVQNNVSLGLKWDAARAQAIVSDYLTVSQQIQDADLIVWPEAAVPFYADQLPASFWQQLQSNSADFLFGVLYRENSAQNAPYYNSVAAVSKDDPISFYKKQQLVPFGEYFPLQFILKPFIEMLHIPMSDFNAWKQVQQPVSVAGGKFAVSICYEDAFPQVWRNQVKTAGALFNVSEDIWFGDSLAPHQRLQMARFRSLETQKPMVRSANNGLSAIIDKKGNVVELAPQFERNVVRGSFRFYQGMTPYVAFGNKLVIGLLSFILLFSVLLGLLIKRPNKTSQ